MTSEEAQARAPLGFVARQVAPSAAARRAVQLVERIRPHPLRPFDQIAIQHLDLARQAELIAPSLADAEVVFMGDYDGMSLMLGLLGAEGVAPFPARMTVLDFDERLLERYSAFAARHRFSRHFDARLWNAFDPVPDDIVGKFDAFYTNPPYGSKNKGASQRLFLARCIELLRRSCGVFGYAVFPYDDDRPWTKEAMFTTQAFMGKHGWGVREMGCAMHGYHLDDDPALLSASVCFEAQYPDGSMIDAVYAGRRVGFEEIPYFYGGATAPPYPRYVREDQSFEYWPSRRLS